PRSTASFPATPKPVGNFLPRFNDLTLLIFLTFTMTDPISDMLTRIRNANRALLPTVALPHSKMKESIAGILKKEGYIADFGVEGKLPKKLNLKLKYQGKKSVIEGLSRI